MNNQPGSTHDGRLEDDEKKAAVGIDQWELARKIVADRRPEDAPESWHETGWKMRRDLMVILGSVTGLAAEVLKSAVALARGVGNFGKGVGELPAAAARSLERGRENAERRESRAIENACLPGTPPTTTEEAKQARDLIAALIESKTHQGYHVRFEPRHNGGWAIVVVRPELKDAADQQLLLAEQERKLIVDSKARPKEQPSLPSTFYGGEKATPVKPAKTEFKADEEA